MSRVESALLEAMPASAWLEALSAVADRAGLGLVVTASSPIVRNILVNDTAEALLGWPREELFEKEVWSLIAPEDLARILAEYEAGLRHEPVRRAGVVSIVRKDGTPTPIDYASAPITLGDQPGTVALIRAAVAQGAGEPQGAPRQAHQHLAEHLESIAALSSGIAHEINNPLGYMRLNLDILARELPELIADEAQRSECMERLELIAEGVERIAKVVRDFRSPAK